MRNSAKANVLILQILLADLLDRVLHFAVEVLFQILFQIFDFLLELIREILFVLLIGVRFTLLTLFPLLELLLSLLKCSGFNWWRRRRLVN